MSDVISPPGPEGRVFEERLRARVLPEAVSFGMLVVTIGLMLTILNRDSDALAFFVLVGGTIVLLGAGLMAFFRNPPRALPTGDPSQVFAPADGRVLCVDEVQTTEGGRAWRIGIFLSLFDVHINRAPVAGRVLSVTRSGRGFLAAFNPRAPRDNVQLALKLVTESGAEVEVVQIVGVLARRIVCHAQQGEWLPRGARYGMIRFGSRTDVLLPHASHVRVVKDDRVRAGLSVLATLPEALR